MRMSRASSSFVGENIARNLLQTEANVSIDIEAAQEAILENVARLLSKPSLLSNLSQVARLTGNSHRQISAMRTRNSLSEIAENWVDQALALIYLVSQMLARKRKLTFDVMAHIMNLRLQISSMFESRDTPILRHLLDTCTLHVLLWSFTQNKPTQVFEHQRYLRTIQKIVKFTECVQDLSKEGTRLKSLTRRLLVDRLLNLSSGEIIKPSVRSAVIEELHTELASGQMFDEEFDWRALLCELRRVNVKYTQLLKPKTAMAKGRNMRLDDESLTA